MPINQFCERNSRVASWATLTVECGEELTVESWSVHVGDDAPYGSPAAHARRPAVAQRRAGARPGGQQAEASTVARELMRTNGEG